ncbi:MAG: lipoyl(octanoyl) transferase LipB [Sphingobacteriales bacterium]|jgi:lipoyl(octanoyl) transferase|nr:lipoyl(octanoyl) transferase LipB [Sphingobacteriales bacterium]
MDNQLVQFHDLGIMQYKQAWEYQERLLQENLSIKTILREATDKGLDKNISVQTQHYLLFVEHPHVFTLGKSGNFNNILVNKDNLAEKGIEFFHINRGGDITYHGSGQIVGYPIFDLEKFYTDIGKYLRNIEEVIILTLAEYGLKGERSQGETGVWLDPQCKGYERKICAIGVRTSRWVTMHGFALNVNTDLNYFNLIVPCGIQGKQVTSLQKELGKEIDVNEVKGKLKRNFEKVFSIQLT